MFLKNYSYTTDWSNY